MRPGILAVLLLLHALAHAGPGMWAAANYPAWVVSPLWFVSMVGFLASSAAIGGLERLRPRAEMCANAATIASAILLNLSEIGIWSAGGILISVVLSVLVRWWARCTHPEIHTPTISTRSDSAATERPSLLSRAGAGVTYAFLGVTAALILLRPWHSTWGTTAAERAAPVPGVPVEGPTTYRIDHAVTIRAAQSAVWSWLAQIGQDRAGFYSHDWLERAVGDEIRNVDSLVPAWQERRVGELVRAAQPGYLGGRLGEELGWRISRWHPPNSVTLEQWGTFVVGAIDDSTSRLRVHTRRSEAIRPRDLPLAAIGLYLFEPAHFIMERGMLLGIKSRAERAAATSRQATQPVQR